MLFLHLKVSSSHLLIHTKNTQSISFHPHSQLHDENQKQSSKKIDNSAVCWQLQKIFASQCDKLFIFLVRNQSICKCVTTVRKDSAYQFSHKVTTQLKFSKNWQLNCLLTCSDNFFITMLQTVYTFTQKWKNMLKSQNSLKRPSLPVFTQGYTAKIFKKLTT